MAIQLNYQAAALRVCVDTAEAGCYGGRVVGQRLSDPIHFRDITDFVTQVDALLDAQRFPQAFQRIRSFTDKSLPDVPAVTSKEEMSAAESAAGDSYVYNVTYAIYRNDGSFRNDIDSNAFKTLIFYLVPDGDSLKIDAIDYYRKAK